MPILDPKTTLWIGAMVGPALFALAAYFTRASLRRTWAALASAAAFGLGNALWDQLAFVNGWWSYPAFAGSGLVWFLYLPAGLVAGGAAALVGWRVIRRYGARGLVVFLMLWTLWGVLHDFGGGALFQSSNLLVFAAGPIPMIMDAILYASCAAVSQLTLRLIAGPASGDALSRS